MFDIGWTEMLVIAIVMIVVVGPKDLPKMLRTFGRTTTKLRAMAGDFRKQFDEALKEAELDDVKGLVDDMRKLNPANEIKQALNPMQKAAADVRAGLDSALNPKTPDPKKPETPAAPAPTPAEAIAAAVKKNGKATASDASAKSAEPAAAPEPQVPVTATLARPELASPPAGLLPEAAAPVAAGKAAGAAAPSKTPAKAKTATAVAPVKTRAAPKPKAAAPAQPAARPTASPARKTAARSKPA